MKQNYSTWIIAVLSAIITLCVASIRHMSDKAKELSDAVLVQNLRISELEKNNAVYKYRIEILECKENERRN